MGKKVPKNVKETVTSTSRARGKNGIAGPSRVNLRSNRDRMQKNTRADEPLVKEEGEMSDHEEVYEQFKEVKWMEWCQDVMADEVKTLDRLHRLQTTSANLPKDKVHLFSCSFIVDKAPVSGPHAFFPSFIAIVQVLARIRKYLQLIGRRIDRIVFEHEEEPHKQDSMFFVSPLCIHLQPMLPRSIMEF